MKTPEPNLLKALSQIQALPDIPESKNPETHTCHTCGHTWKHGAHGGHSCVDRLVPQLAAMQADRDAAQARELALREALEKIAKYDKDTRHGEIGICPYGCDTPSIAQTALSSPPPPVVTVAEHEAVKLERDNWQETLHHAIQKRVECANQAHEAEQDAERLANTLGWALSCGRLEARVEGQAKQDLAAHESRKDARNLSVNKPHETAKNPTLSQD